MSIYQVDKLISEARRLAVAYRQATGRPLPGVSGEIAIYDAARLLDLEPVQGQGGYDAIGRGPRAGLKIQIKGRAVFGRGGERIGQVKLNQDWDALVLVIMDDSFETLEIYEAPRAVVCEQVDARGGSQRKGVLSVARFRHFADLVWERGVEAQADTEENRAAD